MTTATRMVPKWSELQSEIAKRFASTQKLSSEDGEVSGRPVTLSDITDMVFKVSRFPNEIQTLQFYNYSSCNYFVCFDWSSVTSVKKRKIKVWIQSQSDINRISHKEYTLATKAYIKKVCFNTRQRVFITFCEDLHFRLYGDEAQKMKLRGTVRCPYSVISMAYNEDTGELVTGVMGAIVFWQIIYGHALTLKIAKVMNLNSAYLVKYIMFEPIASWMVVVCEDILKIFDYQAKTEVKTLWHPSRTSMACTTLHWRKRYIYAGDVEGHLNVWSFDTTSAVYGFKAHRGTITSVVIRLAVNTLFTASMDHSVKEWNLSTFELMANINLEDEVLLFQMIGNNSFYCHTTHTFSIWSLNTFYKLFNATGSLVKKMSRVQCFANTARIIASTEDGMIRFLSPITGELLLLTWPYLVLDRATDYVYDPDIEELFVAVGSGDVLVLNTAICPCPAKYILTASDAKDDKVYSLVSSRQKLGNKMAYLVFSGHKSGLIRLISPRTYHMDEHKIHDGRIIAMCSRSREGLQDNSMESRLVCSLGADSYVSLQYSVVKGKNIHVKVLARIFSNCTLSFIGLIPGHLCTITENNKIRFWNIEESLWLNGKMDEHFYESEEMPTNCITCFDLCPFLGLLLTGEEDGTIRIWNTRGKLQAEFCISQMLSSTCFANPRGDLLIGLNQNIYFISSLQYLPQDFLKKLASTTEREDYIEDPLPFLFRSISSFDIVLVPKYLYSGKKTKQYRAMQSKTNMEDVLDKEASELTANKKITQHQYQMDESDTQEVNATLIDQGLGISVKIPKIKKFSPKPAVVSNLSEDQDLLPEHKKQELFREFESEMKSTAVTENPVCRKWPIAPDGYIPNSVIRAVMWPGGTSNILLSRVFGVRIKKLPVTPRLDKDMSYLEDSVWYMEEDEDIHTKEFEKVFQQSDELKVPDILEVIAKSSWLGKKLSKVNLYTVVRAILERIATAPFSVYVLGTKALVQIFKAYTIPEDLKEEVAVQLHNDTSDDMALKKMEAWRTLVRLNLIDSRDVNRLARSLMDSNGIVRAQARSIMDSVYKVTTKRSLTKLLRRTAITLDMGMDALLKRGKSKTDVTAKQQESLSVTELLVQTVDEQLTEDLHLKQVAIQKKTKGTAEMETKLAPRKDSTLGSSDKRQPKVPTQVLEPDIYKDGTLLTKEGQKIKDSKIHLEGDSVSTSRPAKDEPGKEKSAKKQQTPSYLQRRKDIRTTEKLPYTADRIPRDTDLTRMETILPSAMPGEEQMRTALATTEKGQEEDLKQLKRFPIDPKAQYQTDYTQWKRSLHELTSLSLDSREQGGLGSGSRRPSRTDGQKIAEGIRLKGELEASFRRAREQDSAQRLSHKGKSMTKEQEEINRRRWQSTENYLEEEAALRAAQQECAEEGMDIHFEIHERLRQAALFLPEEQFASLWSDFQMTEEHLKILRRLITGAPPCERLKLPPLLKLSGTKKEAALMKIFCESDKKRALPEGERIAHSRDKMAADYLSRGKRASRLSHDEALESRRPSGRLPPLVGKSGGDLHLSKEEPMKHTFRGTELDSALTPSGRVLKDICVPQEPTAEDELESTPDLTWEKFQAIIPCLAQLEPLYREDRQEWQSILSWLRIKRQLQSPKGRMREEDTVIRKPLPVMICKVQEVISASLGQRVLRRMQIGKPKALSVGNFHHIIPLSWQNNVHTLRPMGEFAFGKLELDWITIQPSEFMHSLMEEQQCH